jgi:hypothetical protein
VLAGGTMASACRLLDRLAVPPPQRAKRWVPNSLKNVLRNPPLAAWRPTAARSSDPATGSPSCRNRPGGRKMSGTRLRRPVQLLAPALAGRRCWHAARAGWRRSASSRVPDWPTARCRRYRRRDPEQHKRLIASLEASLAPNAIDPADAERVISFCESLWDAKLAVLNSLLAEP